MWLVALFIAVGVISRLFPHPPNFSPLVAIALFAGVYWNKRWGFLLPLIMYVLSDIIIGLHNTVAFTWSSLLLVYFLGTYLRKRKSAVNTVFFTISSSFLFFLITNFGVWVMGWYPHTLKGLVDCYLLAIPFLRTSLMADLIYVVVFFGTYEYFLASRPLAQKAV